MLLKELKDAIDKCYKDAGKKCRDNVEIEFWLTKKDDEDGKENKSIYIESIGQFSIIPDVTVLLEEEELEQ